MVNPILLLGAGAAAVLFSGGKKKRRQKSLAGQPCEVAVGTPSGYYCGIDSLLHTKVVDEGSLETDQELSGDEVGDFETKEEDVSLNEGEEPATAGFDAQPAQDPKEMCEEFLQAIYVVPTEEDELPINAVAIEQTAMPAMKSVMMNIAQNIGRPVDPETVGPVMVQEALAELIPVCKWKYDEQQGEFIYNDGETIDSDIGKEVLYGLMNLSVQMIEGFNAADIPDPAPGDPQGMGFQTN